MARSAVLNIIFGAETAQLERALGGVQKRLRRTATQFKQLGDSMSRSVSLPIIGVGAAAVKAASDLETLETSFVSLAGGADQAAKLVSELNDFTAKTPFQLEAVGTAARQLIAAGTPISEVKDQLQFLGDVAATSGSSIDEIAAIFSKVQAKGKVELESLNQLAERGIPIFTALSKATGLPASELGAGAVSLEQFNDTLASFSKEGGFAAGAMERLSQTASGKFSTALDNLKLAGAELGAELLPLIKDLLDQVVEVAQSFARLDSRTKKLIVRLAAVAAAIGPVSKGIGGLINGVADLRTGFQGLGKRAPQLIKLLTNPWVLVGAAVLAAGVAIYDYNKSVDQTAIVQGRLQNAQDMARKGYVQEQAEVGALLKQYKFYEGDLETRKKILGDLNDIAPDYFGDLDAEKSAYSDLAKAAKAYNDEIRKQAVQKAFGEELVDVTARQLELDEELREKKLQLAEAQAKAGKEASSLNTGTKDFNDSAIQAQSRVTSLQREVNNLTDELNAQTTAQDRLQEKIARANQSLKDNAEANNNAGDSADGSSDSNKKQIATLQQLQDESAGLKKKIRALQDEASQGVPVDTSEIDKLRDKLKDTQAKIDLLTAPTAPIKVPIDFGDDGNGIVDDLGEQIAAIEGEFAFTGNEADRVLALANAYRQAALEAARLGDIELAKQLEAIDPSVQKAADSILRSRDAVASLGVTSNQTTDLLGALGAKSAEVAGVVVASTEQLTPAQQKVQDFASAATSAIEGALVDSLSQVAVAIGSAAAGVDEPLKNLGSTLLSTFASLAMELGGLAIGYGIAIESIKQALIGLQAPVAIAAGVALLALGAGLQAAVSKSADDAGVPAFAQGGLVTGPTLAMVGDNPSGKEAIIPFERMGEFMKMTGGGGGQQNVVVTGRISGKDIVLSNERAGRDRSRIK